MDFLKQFVIPYSGLTLGHHQYEFVIGDKFFESIEYAEIQHGDILVKINLEKTERMLIFNFDIEGSVNLECDRCLEPFDMSLQGHERLIVKFGEAYAEESEEMIVIPFSEHQFNIAHLLYEYISLTIPFQRFHPEDEFGESGCDPEFLNKLKEFEADSPTDPLWDKLKGIKPEEN
ncbi:MAG: DUF177 domain-containing protein [Bacteroidota bacterium]